MILLDSAFLLVNRYLFTWTSPFVDNTAASITEN